MVVLTPLTKSKIRELISMRKGIESRLRLNPDWGKEYNISVVYNTDSDAVISVSITDTHYNTVKRLQTTTVEEFSEVLKTLR